MKGSNINLLFNVILSVLPVYDHNYFHSSAAYSLIADSLLLHFIHIDTILIQSFMHVLFVLC